jgi:hypothetical protein
MNQTVIYRIYVDGVDECYIGRTTMQLYGSQGRLAHHISQSKTDCRHASSSFLIDKYGEDALRIEELEVVAEYANPDVREAYWIKQFRTVNQNMPQPPETNQRTDEGKAAYMEKWREENKDRIRAYDAERRALQTIEDKAKLAEQKREWIDRNYESHTANMKTKITCPKCGEEYTKKSKWRHDAKHTDEAEASAKKEKDERDMLRAECVRLSNAGMTLRKIAESLSPKISHWKVRQLLTESNITSA